MVSVIKETNDSILKIVDDLKSKLEESHALVNDIQGKMDAKLNEAKQYKVQVDDAKSRIKTLEGEIKSLNEDLLELKEKYGKKNLVAIIEAGTKEINIQIKQKQDEIAVHKNKIAELTSRARSIKDLLLNLKKDKKIKEVRLNELENCVHYYGARLDEVVKFTNEHEDLNDYFITQEPVYYESDNQGEVGSVFEDIASIDEPTEEENKLEEKVVFEPVTDEEADEIFSDVINGTNEESSEDEIEETDEEEIKQENIEESREEEVINDPSVNAFNLEPQIIEEVKEEPKEQETIDKTETLEENPDLEINNDLLTTNSTNENTQKNLNVEKLNKAIDEEFNNIFGKSINEPITNNTSLTSEVDIVNSLTSLGLDYYAFKESERSNIVKNYNEQTVSGIINVLKENNISLDNLYEASNILTDIAPAELSNIINKLLSVGQSTLAISYVLDKLPQIDVNLLDKTINNYGEYIKNVDLTDLIIKSLKGGI